MSKVLFKNVNKIYPNHVQAVFDFNLEVKDKEFVVLVGPSGCGKSTTLRMLAGLETISSGEIIIDDVVVNEVEPKDRDIAMVFQSYALYPHLTVYDNMAFSLKMRKAYFPVFDAEGKPVLDCDYDKIFDLEDQIEELKQQKPVDQIKIADLKKQIEEEKHTFNTPKQEYRHYKKSEIDVRIQKAAEILGLIPYLKRKPKALSGGQRQRVALGRAIVRTPKVFLMDEPLSNLDAKLRVAMRSEIAKIHKRVGATTIYVTHDQTEAMTMADRIVVMKDGYVQQIGTPKEIYNKPNNMFVADFVGAPAMNFIRGKIVNLEFVVPSKDGKEISFKLNKEHQNIVKEYEGKDIVLGIRPEDISLIEEKDASASYLDSFEMECDVSELLGYELVLYGYLNNQRIVSKSSASKEVNVGDIKKYAFNEDKIHFFDPTTTMRID